MTSTILVTGGLGYIGSQVTIDLIAEKYNVILLDKNQPKSYQTFVHQTTFLQVDLLDYTSLQQVFNRYPIDLVIHFAALTNVAESQNNPLEYYKINVVGTFNLLTSMLQQQVKKIVFSSTAAVYGSPKVEIIDETLPKQPINVYGKTKSVAEEMIQDWTQAHSLQAIFLRYFNAAGADWQNRTGEDHDPETHLIPLVLRALDQGQAISIFGDDYPTYDGTCIRDYVHTVDLSTAHLAAAKYLLNLNPDKPYCEAINLGTSTGHSVQEIIHLAAEITGLPAKTQILPRRTGDPAKLIASNQKAKQLLDWQPKSNLQQILETAWSWYQKLKTFKKLT